MLVGQGQSRQARERCAGGARRQRDEILLPRLPSPAGAGRCGAQGHAQPPAEPPARLRRLPHHGEDGRAQAEIRRPPQTAAGERFRSTERGD